MKKLFLLVIIAFLLNGCKGKDGAAGVVGPTGNANVQTLFFTVQAYEWTKVDNFSYTYIRSGVYQITQAIRNNGAVLVYGLNGANGWLALPYSRAMTTSYHREYYYAYNTNELDLFERDSDGLVLAPSGGQSYKVIIIAGNATDLLKNTDRNDYNAVMSALQLDK